MWDDLDFPTQCPAAFIYDAPAGAVLHALGPEASSVFQRLDKMKLPSLQWAPDCHHLLVFGDCRSARGPNTGLPGVLAVMNVPMDRVLACSDIWKRRHREERELPAATWHPHLIGIVTGGDVRLADSDCFRQAGICLGTLPRHMHVGDGFSADGMHFSATYRDRSARMAWLIDSETYAEFPDMLDRYKLLACHVADNTSCFTSIPQRVDLSAAFGKRLHPRLVLLPGDAKRLLALACPCPSDGPFIPYEAGSIMASLLLGPHSVLVLDNSIWDNVVYSPASSF